MCWSGWEGSILLLGGRLELYLSGKTASLAEGCCAGKGSAKVEKERGHKSYGQETITSFQLQPSINVARQG